MRSRGCGSASGVVTPGGIWRDHVLARFEDDEREAIAEAVTCAADAVDTFLADGIDGVMNRFNRVDPARRAEDDGEREPG